MKSRLVQLFKSQAIRLSNSYHYFKIFILYTASPLQDASSSPAKAPKPMVLFEADEDESDDEESPEGSPKIDERYFRPSAVTTPG